MSFVEVTLNTGEKVSVRKDTILKFSEYVFIGKREIPEQLSKVKTMLTLSIPSTHTKFKGYESATEQRLTTTLLVTETYEQLNWRIHGK